MPLLPQPSYRPPVPFRFPHFNTIYPTLFRRPPQTLFSHERIELDDGDFLDIDWHLAAAVPCRRLAVISHGLEGNARKKYMLGMAAAVNRCGWDAICLNFRGCSEEMNRLPRLYHSGVTDDLHTVLCHGLQKGDYTEAAVIGFSMGGNQTLKYLGEDPSILPAQLVAGLAFSVPCRLDESCRVLDRLSNRIYMEYFMKGLHKKVRLKAKKHPEFYPLKGLLKMRSFFPFDDTYTAPVHGFSGAMDYYMQSSAKQFLPSIKVPTLLVQAADDPFLSPGCYPIREAEQSSALYLEIPKYGGHVGFMNGFGNGPTWSETRAASFLNHISNGG